MGMARRPRLQFQGAVYHVHTRGNRKERIFADDVDRESFMRLVAHVHGRYEFRFYAVCLMDTHYHAIVETPRGNLSEGMRQINGVFTQITNTRHDRVGHLFGERFSSTVIERDRHLRRAVRYVARNPVKAALVNDPAEWPWSTFRATAGLEAAPAWLSLDWLPWAFAVESLDDAQRRFREYVNRTPKPIDWNALAYGSPEFEAALAQVARQRRAERPLPRKPPLEPPPALETIFRTIDSLDHRNRLIQFAHVKHGYPLADISRHLNLHAGAAARIVRQLESRAR